MKCQKCGAMWPDDIQFCGKCGEKLLPVGGGLSASQTEINTKLKELLPRIGKFREIQPGLHISQKGSTHVEVRIVPLGNQTAVRSMAPVTIGTPITQELLRFLLNENGNLLFGAFALGPKNEIIYRHAIMASSLDLAELASSVTAVVNMADKYDDQIVKQWGGKTMRQTAVEAVLTPAMQKALEKAKATAGQQRQRPARVAPTPVQPAGANPAAAKNDVSQAIKVNSVPEEYAYIARMTCKCGGKYSSDGQSLLPIQGKMYDQMAVSCKECGDTKRLLFDINSFFGKKK